ncbi:DUF4214 domain-containing protein [bacterium]|nr:DUF4214 domain-containing protein [bacterium]
MDAGPRSRGGRATSSRRTSAPHTGERGTAMKHGGSGSQGPSKPRGRQRACATTVIVGAALWCLMGGVARGGAVPGLTLIWPVPSVTTNVPLQDYAQFNDGSANRHHAGIDIPAQTGTAVVAAAAGVVRTYTLAAHQNKTHCFGNAVMITHAAGATLYGHLATVGVTDGQVVAQGDPIGTVGNTLGLLQTGESCGSVNSHLHFEVKDHAVLGTTSDDGVTWGYTPELGVGGLQIAAHQPDAYGYHDPVLNLHTGISDLAPTSVVVTADGAGASLRTGPGTTYRSIGVTVAAGQQFSAIRQRTSSSGCDGGWFQIVNGNGQYFVDNNNSSQAGGVTSIPEAWICRGTGGQVWVQPSVGPSATPTSTPTWTVGPGTATRTPTVTSTPSRTPTATATPPLPTPTRTTAPAATATPTRTPPGQISDGYLQVRPGGINFPDTLVGQTTMGTTVQFQVVSSSPLYLQNIFSQGAGGYAFLPSGYPPLGSFFLGGTGSTFQVAFAPYTAGALNGSIAITYQRCTQISPPVCSPTTYELDVTVTGTGLAPSATPTATPTPGGCPSGNGDFTWTRKQDSPAGGEVAGSAVVNGNLYTIGNGGSLRQFWKYEPAGDSWSRQPDMPGGCLSGACGVAAVGGRIYVVSDGNSVGAGTATQIFDTSTGQWTLGAAIPVPRVGPSVAAVAGKLYAIGGSAGDTYLGSVAIYDPTADSWTAGADMPTARANAAAAVLDNRVYVISGRTSGGGLSPYVEAYDPAANTWWSFDDHWPGSWIPTRRSHAVAAVVGCKIYVAGGRQDATSSNAVEEFDPATEAFGSFWTTKTPLQQARHSFGGGAVGTLFIAAGGELFNNFLTSLVHVEQGAFANAPIPTPTSTHTQAPSPTLTRTATATSSPTPPPAPTATRTATATVTRTPTRTFTSSATPTATRTATATRTRTGTATFTASATPTVTFTATVGPTPVEREPRARSLITSFYVDILGRQPEAGAVDSWYNGYFLAAVNNGIDVRYVPSEMARLFFGSQEYANRNRTNAQFITDCYQAFLRRQPAQSELDAWLADPSWTRPQVVALFAQSAEFGNYLQGQFPGLAGLASRNLVTAMYIGLLDRLVDSAGLNYFGGVFATAFASGGIEGVRREAANLGRAVLGSAEYLAKNPTNATHVERLYRAYLGRFPAASEQSYWVGELAAGRQTTDSLITAFANSSEFTAILNAKFH